MEVFVSFARTAWNIQNRSTNALLFMGLIITLRKAFLARALKVMTRPNKEQKGVKISGPMDKFSNQHTPQLTSA